MPTTGPADNAWVLQPSTMHLRAAAFQFTNEPTAPLKVQTVDVRETTLDVAGQEIMTADKVTLRRQAWPTTLGRRSIGRPSWLSARLSAAANWTSCSQTRTPWRPNWKNGCVRRSAALGWEVLAISPGMPSRPDALSTTGSAWKDKNGHREGFRGAVGGPVES